jgi:pimeloyl-ACP methyl ester carboxylesterase
VKDEPHLLELEDGRRIAARVREGRGPATLLFLPGYASDMEGTKAISLDAWAAEREIGLVRFDYSGTGASPGEFADGTLDRWLEEAIAVTDQLTSGPVVAVGSSMGGWLALHLALKRPNRVRGLLGIAAAPDFTEWGYTGDEKQRLSIGERIEKPNPYGGDSEVTTAGFWCSGLNMLLLSGELAIDCPVRLLHGDQDAEVPVEIALRLKDVLRSADVQLSIVKGGGHRLSAPHEIRIMLRAVADLLELVS